MASHAQKHFIKLCMSGAPLPARVCESGRGYTLSGNLLDPASAAAAAYGFSYDLLMERKWLLGSDRGDMGEGAGPAQ